MTQPETTRTTKHVLAEREQYKMTAAAQTKEHEEDKTYRDAARENKKRKSRNQDTKARNRTQVILYVPKTALRFEVKGTS